MKPPRRGTRVCREAIMTVGDEDPFPIITMYARRVDDGHFLATVHTVLRDPFEVVIPKVLPDAVMNGRSTSAQTSLGELRLRPLRPEDADWLPLDFDLPYDTDMLKSFIHAIDAVESSDDEGPYEIEDGPISRLDLILSPDTEKAIGLRWSLEPGIDGPSVWYRVDGEWSTHSPLTNRAQLEATAKPDPTEPIIRPVHPSAAQRILERFDSKQPISLTVAYLAARDQHNSYLHRSDLPEGLAARLAEEWLQSGGDRDDILVAFAEGRAEPETAIILEAVLTSEQRATTATENGNQFMGAVDGTGWAQLAQLAIAAGEHHMAHDRCDSLVCARFHSALALVEATDGGTGIKEYFENPERHTSILLAQWTVSCIPVRTPFSGLAEAPPGMNYWHQRFGPRIHQEAQQFTETLIEFLVALFKELFPSCGSIDVAAYLSAQGLEPPDNDDDEW